MAKVERIGFGCFVTRFRLTQFKKELNHGVEGRCFYVRGRKECREAAAVPVDPACDHSCLLCTMGIPRVDGDHGNRGGGMPCLLASILVWCVLKAGSNQWVKVPLG